MDDNVKAITIYIEKPECTREEAIHQLIAYDVFTDADINTPAMEYYIKYMMEGEDPYDIDHAAWLNTLFGYDIGYDNAMEIYSYMLEDMDTYQEIMDFSYCDKNRIKEITDKLGLELDYSKYRTNDDITCFEFFQKESDKMKKYNVDIQCSGWYSVRVSAESEEDAERMASEMFNEADFGEGYNIDPGNMYVD